MNELYTAQIILVIIIGLLGLGVYIAFLINRSRNKSIKGFEAKRKNRKVKGQEYIKF